MPDGGWFMPRGAEALSVGLQDGQPYLWALVDPEAPKEWRTFAVAGTGHALPPESPGRFIGSIIGVEGWIVLHVWERAEGSGERDT
jgi:hypothetical protein